MSGPESALEPERHFRSPAPISQPGPEREPGRPTPGPEPEQSISPPPGSGVEHSSNSGVWVTPAEIVEAIKDGSDTTVGDFRSGAPFENVSAHPMPGPESALEPERHFRSPAPISQPGPEREPGRPTPGPEPEPEQSISPPPGSGVEHSSDSGVWVTPAEIVEAIEDGSDTTVGDFRSGAPFENVSAHPMPGPESALEPERHFRSPAPISQPGPEREPERPTPGPELEQSISPPPGSGVAHSPNSGVWVTPAGIVEAIEDGSDTTVGDFRFGAPFENVRPQSTPQGAEAPDAPVGPTDANDVQLDDTEHERMVWEHFMMLGHDSQSRVLHGLFGMTHPQDYPAGSHDVYGSTGHEDGTGVGNYEIRSGTARASSFESPSRSTSFLPLRPGQVGFASSLNAGLITPTAENGEQRREMSATSPGTDSTYGVPLRRGAMIHQYRYQHHQQRQQHYQHQQEEVVATHSGSRMGVGSVGHETTATVAAVQSNLADNEFALIGRALVSGNCLLDAC